MPSLSKNIASNLAASFAVALLSFIFVPVYIHALGIEAWGLIGFFVSIQALLSLLDLGLGTSLNRELARLSGIGSSSEASRNLTRTLEVVYWGVAGLIALVIAALAPWLAEQWLNLGALSAGEAQQALTLMGVAFAARWPFALYAGALSGLERQPLLNLLRVSIETLRSGGAALVLWALSPTLTAFLLWQIGVAIVGSLAAAWTTWHALPSSDSRPRFEWRQLRRIGRFMVGISGIAVTVLVLTQADKVALSKLLPLGAFGYYMLAWAVANALSNLVGPVYTAFFPRISRAVASGDEDSVLDLYHRASQLMSALILPVGITLAFFSHEVLLLWTRDPSLADHTYLILTILVFGTLMNGLMNIPYALLLAYGWTSLPFYANLIAIVLLVPLVVILANAYGAVGAACVWLALNACHLLLTQQVMHTRILRLAKSAWFLNDVGKPLAVTILVAGSAKLVLGELTALQFAGAGLAVLALSAAASVWSLDRLRPALQAAGARLLQAAKPY